MTRAFLLLLCAVVSVAAPKPALKNSIDRVIARTPSLQSSFIGIHIVRLADGRTLYSRNPDHLFTPASNVKLFTAALALARLGPDYRFRTTVESDPNGDLILVGRGDPSLSARVYPYAKDAPESDPLQAIDALADQVVANGVRRVNGDVIGDDRRYVWRPYPEGWSAGDEAWGYGAPVSALMVNDNEFTLSIEAGAEDGDPARITSAPREPLVIMNRVRTTAGAENSIRVERGRGELRIWGALKPGDSDSETLAVGDPALFAATALRDALERRGVVIEGVAVARHRYRDEVSDPETARPAHEVALRMSPPLIELLKVTEKISQNLHAEIFLREVAAVTRAEDGLTEMRAFVEQIGIDEKDIHLVDGSGLSRDNLVTPQAVTRLLTYMYHSAHRNRWMDLLPIGGVDGTLEKRFQRHPEAAAIHAKTGSLSHVRALSGYAVSKRYGMIAFSMLINNHAASALDLGHFLDTIGLKLLD
jgi:D-alanyl-D-alanine carboxypeptidase/D-alanyl-D-alanine-endopeptidase (penicillin-binding protein 4)